MSSEKGSLRPCVLWLTGLPAAGKTTLAGALASRLRNLGLPVCVLDGDDLRRGLNADLGFSEADRDENVRRTAEVARLLLDAEIFVVAALISPFRAGRKQAGKRIGAGRFVEIFVDRAAGSVPTTRSQAALRQGARRRNRRSDRVRCPLRGAKKPGASSALRQGLAQRAGRPGHPLHRRRWAPVIPRKHRRPGSRFARGWSMPKR